MGKRELLLVVAFLAVGFVVYQVTAPPPGPNERGFSFGALLESARREIRGNRANAEVKATEVHPADATVVEFRLAGSFGEITITGEEREDVETTIRVQSNGYDEAQAKDLASKTTLKRDRAGGAMGFRVTYPDGGRQRAFLTVKVPARLRLRIDATSSRLNVSNVAAADFTAARGETMIKQVAGRLVVSHRGGKIVIEDAGSIKFSGRSSDALVSRIRGDSSFVFEAGGELNASDLAGPVEAESRSAELTFNKLEKTRGPIRVNAIGGTVSMQGLSSEARIDGRNTEIEVTMAAAAPVAIYNEGEDAIQITPPPGGFQLDALATDGRISLPDEFKSTIKAEESGDGNPETRASGIVRGGGPALTLRANHGNITIRGREAPKPDR